MAFGSNLDRTKPADGRNASLGDDDIREFKIQWEERIILGSGGAGDGLLDVSNDRDENSDPVEIAYDKVDTAALDKGLGSYTAIGRAVTYFQIVTLAADFSLADPENDWQDSGLQITIPGTVLLPATGSGAGLEREDHAANFGTGLGTTDYAIKITAGLHCICRNTGNVGRYLLFRIRNVTDDVVIGPGSSEALGATATKGIRSHRQENLFIDADARQWLTWSGFDSARTIATEYQLEVAGSADFSGGHDAGIRASADEYAYLIAEVFKR